MVPALRGLLVTAVLAAAALALLPASHAAVGGNGTVALVNAGQVVHDSSSAVPIFGLAAMGGALDNLIQIDVDFGGANFDPGDDRDLIALRGPADSGLALYRDTGSADDVLDANDLGIVPTNEFWSGNTATLLFTEPVPASVTGLFHWFLVIRTGDDPAHLQDGQQIIAVLQPGSILFSDGSMQPSVNVATSPLTVAVTAVTDLLASNPWIGPAGTSGSARAVLGVRLADGGIAANRGIADRLDRTIMRIVDNGGWDANDLQPLGTNPATSGIGLYRDSNDNDAWDAADIGITLTQPPSVGGSCSGGTGLPVCLFTAEPLPDSPGGAIDFFLTVRAGTLETGDQFSLLLLGNEIRVIGTLGADNGRLVLQDGATSSSLSGDVTPPCISISCGVSNGPMWQNPGASPYLAISPGQTALFFSSLMPSAVTARLHYHALDTESGLGTATFSTEPSLASSPASQSFGGTLAQVAVYADYTIDAASSGADAPMTGTVSDAVGNTAFYGLEYAEDNAAPTITPSPGWTNFVQPPFWSNATGTLWFSDWITGFGFADVRVNLADEVSGLANASATVEPSLRWNPNYLDSTFFAGGTGSYLNWDVRYFFDTAGRATDSPVELWACDNVANCGFATFAYAEDNTPPVVTITWPTWGEVLSGWAVPTATVTDADTATGTPVIRLVAQLADTPMFWNGSDWTYGLQTALYPDGPQRILVSVTDKVGNLGASLVDVNLLNSAPTLDLLTPAAGDLVRGTVAVTAIEANGSPVTAAEVRIDSGAWVPMVPDAITNVFSFSWDTSALSGAHSVSVRGYNGGLAGSVSSSTVTVDNVAPALGFVDPVDAAEVSGGRVVRVTASDALGLDSVSLRFDSGGWIPLMYDVWTGTYGLTWDTLAVADGAHTLSAQALDVAGNSAVPITISVLVDNSAPSLVVVSPAGAVPLSGSVTLNITADDSAGSGFDATGWVRYRLDSGSWIALVGGPTSWTASLDTTAFGDGAHTLSFEAVDDAGNAATAALAVSVDNTNPFAAVLSPISAEFVSGVLTIDVQASDGVGLDSLAVTVTYQDLSSVVLTRTFAPGTGDRYAVAVNTGAWSDGDYTIAAVATDGTGRTASDSIGFRLDNQAPALSVAVPTGGAIVEGSVLLQATATDRYLAAVDYRVDGASWITATTAFDTTAVIDGPHTLEVRARDLAGRETTQSLEVLVDNTPPQVALLLPLPMEVLSATVRVEAVAVDANGVAAVTLTTGSAPVDMILDASTGRYVALVDSLTLADGSVTITVQASDAAGHTATASRTATVDNGKPNIVPGAVQIWPGRGKITATVDDPSGVALVEVNIDGAAWQVMAKDSGGTYTHTFHTEVGDNGGHSYEVRATDSVGNVDTKSGSFLVDNPSDWWGAFLAMVPFIALVFALLILWLLFRWIRRGKLQRWWEEGVAETRAFLEADEARFKKLEAPKEKPAEPAAVKDDIEIPAPPKEPSEFLR